MTNIIDTTKDIDVSLDDLKLSYALKYRVSVTTMPEWVQKIRFSKIGTGKKIHIQIEDKDTACGGEKKSFPRTYPKTLPVSNTHISTLCKACYENLASY